MDDRSDAPLADTGERMIPTGEGEVSVVFSRHQFAYRYARQFVRDKNVLDVGCGTGYGCKILAEQANRVLGIDHDASAVEYCRRHYGAPNVDFQHLDVTSLNLNDKFDVAVSFQVIEHVRDTDDFVRRIRSAVKVGGLILISTPNVKTMHPSGDRNPFHFSEMNYEEFTELMERHFDDYRILGIGYQSGNWLRSIVQKLPFYRRLGLLIRRESKVKALAAKAMDATRFDVLDERITDQAIDLLAVCTNQKNAA